MKTVKEVIEYLKTLEQDCIVLVKGYEGGYDDFREAYFIEIQRDVNEDPYCGDHEESKPYIDKPVYKAYSLEK